MGSQKYGRTYHLPMSPGVSSDDKIIRDLSRLEASQDIVITEKMDGENTTIFAGGCHPRSLDARYHPSRDWMKAYAAGISPMLATDERIVGEYLFARHSIAYDALPSYFLGFGWVVNGVFQSWDDTVEKFDALGINSVHQLYRGPYSDAVINQVIADLNFEKQEGFVVRLASAFQEAEMSVSLAKYVREDHVQSDEHWMNMEVIKNGLA
ncbi:MAG: RNA ligase family protein [Pseudomonadota bacterium]